MRGRVFQFRCRHPLRLTVRSPGAVKPPPGSPVQCPGKICGRGRRVDKKQVCGCLRQNLPAGGGITRVKKSVAIHKPHPPVTASEAAGREMLKAGRAAAYQFTLRDKLVGALADLKIRFFPRRILVAGPYVGEFGHELMDWQPWVRAQVGRYEQVHVITYPGRDYLYPGCQVHHHDVALETAGYKHGRFSPAQLAAMARQKAAELGLQDYDLMTALNICTTRHQRHLLPARFELLGEPPAAGAVRDVAFHFRQVNKAGPDDTRNYPLELCDRVVEFCRARGLEFFCIGHPRYSYCPPGVADRRTEDLAASVAAIRSARLLAGELSGPMHLAQLSGTAILIWAPGQWRLDNCARWNVFQVPTYIVTNEVRHPSPEEVGSRIISALADLCRRTEDFQKPAYTLPK